MKTRSKLAAVHLEPPLYDLLNEAAADAGQSNSTFLRALLLKDLLEQDRISTKILEIFAGTHVAHVV